MTETEMMAIAKDFAYAVDQKNMVTGALDEIVKMRAMSVVFDDGTLDALAVSLLKLRREADHRIGALMTRAEKINRNEDQTK